ncbi:MAG: hypothetical protein LQ339_007131 [Xanthoria mediterranea]|nr:MAG: hypothetical protein LQ339_007131 [Xanthoria mediterranea]
MHGDRCKTLPLFREEDQIRPRLFVDTQQNCIVESKGISAGYVALSYSWGQTRNLRNELKICEELQVPGVLARDEFHQQLPSTITDAFAIIQSLGQRYLWVDALCIVQDDEQHLHLELNQMHRVYAGAVFTIVAGDGADASHGLRGFKNLTAQRLVQQRPIQLSADESIMQDLRSRKIRNAGDSRPNKVYYDRAWTFQENLFSRKKIIFEDNSVRWRCQCSDWYEDLLPESRVDERVGNFWALPGKYLAEQWFHCSIPLLSILSDIAGAYNTKILTFPEDALSAFAGIQTMLHRTYPGGLIYGVPENFFDIALTWQPRASLARRKPSAKSHSGGLSHKLPSWSWLGWTGIIAFPTDVEFELALADFVGIEGYTMPVTEWYTMSSPTSVERRRIQSRWYENRMHASRDVTEIPTGWRRERFEAQGDFHLMSSGRWYQYPSDIPQYCYKHESIRDESHFYWYPIPVLDRSTPCPVRPQTAFLYAQTPRAFLWAGSQMHRMKDPTPGAPRVQLVKLDGQHVGFLQLNRVSDLADLKSPMDSKPGRRVELVATCKGYTGRIFDYKLGKRIAAATVETPLAKQLKDCYFVLWIEWENGVAYRQAFGAVTNEAWESEKETELGDLILG